MKRSKLIIALTTLLTLLYGQWLYATHAHAHEDAAHVADDVQCQICLHGIHAKSSAPATGIALVLPGFTSLQTAAPPRRLILRAAHRIPEARAPPTV